MSQEVAAIYTGILEQVMRVEKLKRALSKQILTVKDKKRRLDLICKFLEYDLNKHQLFEQAAVIALSNGEDSIAQHIQALYEPFGDGELIERIRKELGYTHRFIQVMDKAKNQPELSAEWYRK
jgi:hypothetical protein